MATRKKKVIITGVSREAADEAFATYAKSDAQLQKINADIELQCAKFREKYADRIATLSEAVSYTHLDVYKRQILETCY